MNWLSFACHQRGQLDSAVVWSDRSFQSNPSFIGHVLSRPLILLAAGQSREARRLVNGGDPFWPATLYVLAATGDTATVHDRLRTLARGAAWYRDPETARAWAMLGMGDTARALEALERATDVREPWPLWLRYVGVYHGVRESARFRALLKRVGMER